MASLLSLWWVFAALALFGLGCWVGWEKVRSEIDKVLDEVFDDISF